ncbi:MAG TPA: hypothetical protein VKU00_10095 [Chthonomonadaceae bacterium]|nr:hypothetical protein [Chthonomonadaceae bacterium]
MKTAVHPAVVITVIVVVAAGAIFFVWRGSQGINTGPGKMQSDLKMDEAAKKAQQDPEAFRKAVQESLQKDKARNGN